MLCTRARGVVCVTHIFLDSEKVLRKRKIITPYEKTGSWPSNTLLGMYSFLRKDYIDSNVVWKEGDCGGYDCYGDAQNPFELPREEFLSLFRLPQEAVMNLVNLLRADLQSERIIGLSAEIKIMAKEKNKRSEEELEKRRIGRRERYKQLKNETEKFATEKAKKREAYLKRKSEKKSQMY